jgi:hypothetical protein
MVVHQLGYTFLDFFANDQLSLDFLHFLVHSLRFTTLFWYTLTQILHFTTLFDYTFRDFDISQTYTLVDFDHLIAAMMMSATQTGNLMMKPLLGAFRKHHRPPKILNATMISQQPKKEMG